MLKELFKVFFKIGAILLGGGYVIVPIMNEELVKKRNWLSEDEVVDFFCTAQCLPGIVAINTAILVGYKLNKFKGVLISVFAMALSPVLSIIIIAFFFNKITSLPFLDSVFWGVNISVIILIYLAIKDIWKKTFINSFSYVWYFLILVLFLYGVSPVLLLFFSIIAGAGFEFLRRKHAK